MSNLVGRTLGHYRVVDQIGAGGMGVVYRAHDERLHRDVALKVLPREVANETDRLNRFEREAQAVAQLAHPNILEIWDFGTEDEVTYAVTELLEGENLRERIPSGGTGWQKAAEVGSAVADGLAAAHSKGIVHRDLKPENIYITSDGRVKILDFGLAQIKEPVREEAETATLTPAGTVPGTVMGTVGYMSPEQVRGHPADARSDIFALGCVLYEMLTGKNAFARDTTADTQAAILKEEAPPLSSSGVTLPADLERSITRCLEKSPEARFQSASDLAFALRSITATGHDVRVVKPGRRRRSYWAAAAASLVVIGAIAAALGLRLFNRPAPEGELQPIRSIALLPLENLTGDPEQEYFVDGLHEELIATFAQISAFDKVIARTSVMVFRDSDVSIREIGKQLGVDAVLEGSVRRSGESVRVTLQLIDARSESHRWADSFEQNVSDILTLQGEIATAVADKIRLAVTPGEIQRLTSTRPVNEEAYRLYLEASRIAPWPTTEANLYSAMGLLKRAIALEPTYADPYSQLAVVLTQLAHYYRDPREVMPEAYDYALRGVELNPSRARAHTVLGMIKLWWQWDWSGARDELERALELRPGDEKALARLADYWAIVGQPDRSVATAERAVELDPMSRTAQSQLGYVYLINGRSQDAINHLQTCLERFPNSPMTYLFLAWSHYIVGQHEQAVAAIEKAGDLHPTRYVDSLYLFTLVAIYSSAGRSDDAATALDRLIYLDRARYVPPSSLGYAFYSIGDHDQAFEYFERALQNHDTQLWNFMTPSPLPYMDDPRCIDIRRRMGYPEP